MERGCGLILKKDLLYSGLFNPATHLILDKILNHIRNIRSYKIDWYNLYDLIILIWFKILSNFIRVAVITEVLGISDKFVSKWKLIYQKEGADALLLKYEGSESYLSEEEIDKIIKY